MKVFTNSELIGPGDKPISLTETEELTVVGAIRIFILSLKVETMDDAEHAHRVLDLMTPIEEVGGSFNMEDADFKWLRESFKLHGPARFGVAAFAINEMLIAVDEAKPESDKPTTDGE